MGKWLAAAINKKHAAEALTRSLLLARRAKTGTPSPGGAAILLK